MAMIPDNRIDEIKFVLEENPAFWMARAEINSKIYISVHDDDQKKALGCLLYRLCEKGMITIMVQRYVDGKQFPLTFADETKELNIDCCPYPPGDLYS